MKKRIAASLSFILALCMVGTACASNGEQQPAAGSQSPSSGASSQTGVVNQTGFPIANEKLTYTIMTPAGDPQETPRSEWLLLKQMEEETNIHIEWDIVHTGFDEKKNLMFASGEYPDAILSENVSDIDIMSNNAVLLPLDDYLEDWAPNTVKMFEEYPESHKISIAPDGKIYGFPQIRPLVDTPQMGVINTKWLRAVGMEIPETLDEFYEVLKAFKEKDPNGNGEADEIPLSFRVDGGVSGWTNLFGPFGILDYSSPKTPQSKHVNVEDGKVVYVPTDPRYKEAISWMHKLYAEGLIDKEVFVQDEQQYSAKMQNETLGVYFTWNGASVMPVEKFKADYAPLMPVKGENGDQLWAKNNSATYRRNMGVIFRKAQNPEALIRWFDYFYDKDISIQAYYGPYGLVIEKGEDGTITFNPEPEGVNSEQFKWRNTFADTSVCKVPTSYLDDIEFSEFNLIKFQNNEDLKPYQPEEIYPAVFYTEEELDKLEVLLVDIDAYVEKQQVKWIMEGGIEEGWDAYLAQLEKLKLPELIEIYQAALDRYNQE